jgi:predicted transcriptional regulator
MSNEEYVMDGDLFEPETTVDGPNGSAAPSPVDPPTVDETLRTLFGLGDSDLRTYEALHSSGPGTTRALAERLDRDRSNVNRSLSRLRESGFVTRRRRVLQSGGQAYQYVPEPPEAVLGTVEAALTEWVESAHGAVVSHFGDID